MRFWAETCTSCLHLGRVANSTSRCGPISFKTGQGAAVGKVLELEGLHKDGHLFPVELSVAAVQLRGEWNAVGVVRDITDRKGAERSIRLLSEAVEQCPASVVITNRKGAIVYVNRKFCDITGYTSEEVLGKNPRLLKSGETSAETYQQLWQCITEGRVWQCEFHNRKKNGELFWEAASISPVLDDQGLSSRTSSRSRKTSPSGQAGRSDAPAASQRAGPFQQGAGTVRLRRFA